MKVLDLVKEFFLALPGMWKHRYLGLLAAVFVALVGAVMITLIPSKYESTARAYVDTQSILKPLMVGMAVQPNVEQQLRMMARALLSRPNLEDVAKQSGLLMEVASQGDRDYILGKLAKEVKFVPDGRSDFFSLTYRSPSQDQALAVVDGLLKLFVNKTRGDQRRDNEQAVAFLDDQIEVYEKRLLEAETKLSDFKVKNLDVMPDLAGNYFATTAEVQKEYDLALLQLRQAVQRAGSLRRERDSVPANVRSNSSLLGLRGPTETERRLNAAKRSLDDLSTRYTEYHPDVRNTSRIIDDLEGQLKQERRRSMLSGEEGGTASMVPNKLHQELSLSIAGADSLVASLRAKVSDTKKRLARVKERAQLVPKVEAEFLQLSREYEVNKSNFDKLLARRESASISGNLDASSGAGDFRVVDPPIVSSSPVSPNRALLLMALLMASCGAGLFVAYLRHQANPAFYDTKILRRQTELPVLGEVSSIREGRARAGSVASAWSFWMLVGLFLLSFMLVIGYLRYGHLIKQEQIPEVLRPLHNNMEKQHSARLPKDLQTQIGPEKEIK